MLYLLDANVLIDGDRDYYPISSVPEYWAWLIHHGQLGNVKVCLEIYEEVTDGVGELPDMLRKDDVKQALLLDEESVQSAVSKVVDEGYAPDLTDEELIVLGRDPFLIAHAMTNIGNRCVVTTERSAPSKRRQNKKIPDVCDHFGVKWAGHTHRKRQILQPVQALSTEGPLSSLCLSA